jgi:hypothetical protein
MPPDLKLAEAMANHGVRFVIVGGHAVNIHGYVRLTEDTDLVWLRSRESEAALLAALSSLDAKYIGNDIDPATGIERLYAVTLAYIEVSHLMMLWTSQGFLDLFDYIPGFPEEDPHQLLATSVEVGGIRFASLEWLRRMKRAAGRTKDLLDLENLPK